MQQERTHRSAPQNAARVSVVVVNYNGGELVLDAVRAVLSSTVGVEVHVVDNASNDGSPQQLRNLFADRVNFHLIENRDNLGFARANNQALRRISSDYALLLNPDCLVQPDTIEQMLQILADRPGVGMAGCLVRNPDGTEQLGCRRDLPTPWSSLVRVLNLDKLLPPKPGSDAIGAERPLPAEPVEVQAISGSFMLVRRAALQNVGLMDEGYFLHCEDLDWCAAFRERGWKILFVPSVDVVHYKGTCSNGHQVRVLWYKHKGMARFYRKFLKRYYPFVLSWLVYLGIWARFSALSLAHAPRNLLRRRLRQPVSLDTREPAPGASVSPADQATSPAGSERPSRQAPALGGDRQAELRAAFAGVPVLVTGATGFIGFRLVEALLHLGAQVTVVSRSASKPKRLWPEGAIRIIQADLTRIGSTQDMCRGIGVVFHLASYAHAADARNDEQQRQHGAVTAGGTDAVVTAAVQAGVSRFVFVSSVKAMGEGGDKLLSEDDEPHPESAYGEAKLAAERAVLRAGAEHGLAVTNLRLPMVYGPGNKGNLLRLIAAVDRGLFPPLPPVENRRSMVHVDDVVASMLLVATSPAAAGRTYIVTDGREYSTGYLYAAVRRALGKREPRWHIPMSVLTSGARLGDRLGSVSGYPMPLDSHTLDKLLGSAIYSSQRIRDELGFVPRYSLEDALPAIVAEYLMDFAA